MTTELLSAQLMNEVATDSLAEKIEAFKRTEPMNDIHSKIRKQAHEGKFEVKLDNDDFANNDTKLLVARILQDDGFQISHGFSWITVSWYTQCAGIEEGD